MPARSRTQPEMRSNLTTFLEDFKRHDREVAVVRMDGVRRRTATYGAIAQLAGRFAAYLEDQGIGTGDRIILWAENSAEWIAAFYGVMLCGALAVPLDAYGAVDFAERVADDVEPRLVVGDGSLIAKLTGEWPRLAFSHWLDVLPAREAGPVDGLDEDSPVQILFTSGTTGDPKGVVHTHGNVLASIEPIERGAAPYMRYEPLVHPIGILHTLPLSHVFGQTMGLWVPAILGARVHFESRLVASRLIETIKSEKISVLASVPRVMGLIKAHLESSVPSLGERMAASQGMKAWQRWWTFRDVHRILGLKFWAFVSGGGALPSSLEQFWNALGLVVIQGYGMTETTALITLNHPFHVASGTIGKPLPGREVKISPDGEVLVRGPMISTMSWTDGKLQARKEEWLATGDIAESQATGELKFLGRKSEVIVTAAGVNVHPEDLESAIEEQSEVTACAVVPFETAQGPEPLAVVAMRGTHPEPSVAIERANARLADFQHVRRWTLWPEPDLPRTSTGKVRRKAVAAWAATNASKSAGGANRDGQGDAPEQDWLIALLAKISGEASPGCGDDLRLSEDFHLDSLGRVQLAASLEERLGALNDGAGLDQVQTLGDLRRFLGIENYDSLVRDGSSSAHLPDLPGQIDQWQSSVKGTTDADWSTSANLPLREYQEKRPATSTASGQTKKSEMIYPRWPWVAPFTWARTAFLEMIAYPLIWLLAKPRVVSDRRLERDKPMLIVCNHVTAYDGPLVQYALPSWMRRKIAIAMSGEMLEDYRHFRNPQRRPNAGALTIFGPAIYYLLTALFNVFPLPRQRQFQKSFNHAGAAMDRGMHVLLFPEGTRSLAGELAKFRPGIGLLVKQARAPVLPVAIRGLGELKTRGKGWFRSGKIEIHVGNPIHFSAESSETEITSSLQRAVEDLARG